MLTPETVENLAPKMATLLAFLQIQFEIIILLQDFLSILVAF